MLQFDEEKLHKIFVEDLGYGENTARRAVENIRRFDEKLQPILDQPDVIGCSH
jgi:hypothetical protein